MTGREFIIYILENHLEDEDMFKNGKFVGLMSIFEVAAKMEVGFETVKTWIKIGALSGIEIDGTLYIPARSFEVFYEKRKNI